jgi:hypothetical protein
MSYLAVVMPEGLPLALLKATRVNGDVTRLAAAGTREEPGTLTQGVPVFSGSSRLGIEPKIPG